MGPFFFGQHEKLIRLRLGSGVVTANELSKERQRNCLHQYDCETYLTHIFEPSFDVCRRGTRIAERPQRHGTGADAPVINTKTQRQLPVFGGIIKLKRLIEVYSPFREVSRPHEDSTQESTRAYAREFSCLVLRKRQKAFGAFARCGAVKCCKIRPIKSVEGREKQQWILDGLPESR